MRRDPVQRLVLGVMAVFAGAASFGVYSYINDRNATEADRRASSAVMEVHRVQLSLYSILGKRSDLPALRKDWVEAGRLFDERFLQLRASSGLGREQKARLSHVEESWLRGGVVNREIEDLLGRMESRRLSDRAGASGMQVAYERMLSDPLVPGEDLGLIGRLLLRIEDYDRQLQDMDSELRALAAHFHAEALRQAGHTRLAGGLSLALAFLGGGLLLWRVLRLHQELLSDNEARIRAENTARAHEEDLRITLDSIGDAVMATDSEGRIVRMNPVAERLTGWTAVEAHGRLLSECFVILNTRTREPSANPVELVLRTGQIVGLANHTSLISRNGIEHQIADSAAPIRDDKGNMRGIVIVFRDVTGQYELEEQLRHAQKMESVGKLAGGVAHDFNNILQVIRANLGFLNEACAFVTPEALLSLDQIGQASERAVALTKQLLAFGRRQKLEVAPADPEKLVSDILKLIRRIIGEHVEIHFSCEPDHLWINVDSNQFEQVVLNLCVNARDAMPEGGRLGLSIGRKLVSSESSDAGTGIQPGTYVVLSVADTGHGMDEATQARMFEPFFTTKPVGHGTGLGLSVVQGIIQQHGGFIRVNSSPGAGTSIDIHMPAIKRPGEPAVSLSQQESLREARPAAGHEQLVLLVEDELSVRSIAERILRREGYKVLVAGDGEDACHLAALHSQELSLVVMDVVMPRLGGVDAARRIHKMNTQIPVLFCSGYAKGLDSVTMAESPGWRFMSKPYSAEELLSAVSALIGPRA